MDDLKAIWIRERAVDFTSFDSDAPLTNDEQTAIDRIINGANCIAIGEAIHGSKTILQSAERLLRFFIQDRQAGILVVESCFGATQALNRHVMNGEGESHEALAETCNWNYSSQELLGFVKWLGDFNRTQREARRPVQVFGCDCQSIDGPKSELLRLLRGFVANGVLSPANAASTTALIASLPTDRDLGRFVDLILREVDVTDSRERRLAEIEAWQSEFVARASASLEEVTSRLRDVKNALPSSVANDDLFVFERCGRLLEQVIAFYSPGDAIEKRDAFMAENILAIQKHFQPRRMVVLSHNLHVARTPIVIRDYQFVPMGSHLTRELGGNYRVIGTAVYQGQYQAVTEYRPEDDLVENAQVPGPLAFESILKKAADERQACGLVVDLSGPTHQECESPWPDGVKMRLGESGRQVSPDDCFIPQRPELQFHGIVFVDRTTPITILPGYYRRAFEQWKSGGAEETETSASTG